MPKGLPLSHAAGGKCYPVVVDSFRPCFITHTFWNSVFDLFRRLVFNGMQPTLWRAF